MVSQEYAETWTIKLLDQLHETGWDNPGQLSAKILSLLGDSPSFQPQVSASSTHGDGGEADAMPTHRGAYFWGSDGW